MANGVSLIWKWIFTVFIIYESFGNINNITVPILIGGGISPTELWTRWLIFIISIISVYFLFHILIKWIWKFQRLFCILIIISIDRIVDDWKAKMHGATLPVTPFIDNCTLILPFYSYHSYLFHLELFYLLKWI